MKKLLLLIILCPTTNMLAMISTKAIPLAQIASLATRFIHTTKTLQDHPNTPTLPTNQNYRSIRYLEETKIRAQLKKEAYEQAYEETVTLKEECRAFIMVLEQQKNQIPFSEYCKMSGKTTELLIKGKMNIAKRLDATIAEIDKKPLILDAQTENELRKHFNN